MTKCVNCGREDDGTLKNMSLGFTMDAAQTQLLQSFFSAPPLVCQPCIDMRASSIAHATSFEIKGEA